MKKKQQLIEFSQLATRDLLKRLDNLKQKLQTSRIKVATGKSSQTSQIRQLRIQVAQIQTLVNQRIMAENLKTNSQNSQ